jgi:short subunit fatty acids transporter
VNNYAARRGWIDAELASTLNYGLSVLTGAAFVAKTNRNSLKIDAAVEQATDAAAIATQTHAELRKGRPVTPLTPAKGVQDVRTDVPVKEVP